MKKMIQVMLAFINYLKQEEPNYPLRIIDYDIKKELPYFKIQVVNTRAVFDVRLEELFANENILNKLDPLQILKIGYVLKQVENQKLASLHRLRKKGFNLWKRVHKFLNQSLTKLGASLTGKFDHTFLFFFKSARVVNKILFLKLSIANTHLYFDIPIDELFKDVYIVKNMKPKDLVTIGYILKEEEMNINALAI